MGVGDGWATCAHTENGFLRVGMNAKFAGRTQTGFVTLMAALNSVCRLPNHHFWTMDISLRAKVPPDTELTANQIADIYLLALAIERGGKFVTFDRSIPARLLPGGEDALVLIPQ
jgi:predicted nucleic acid-binding protein